MPSDLNPLGKVAIAWRALRKLFQLRRPASPLRVGDHFRKAHDQFGKVWEVFRIWTTVDNLVHVRLKSLDEQGETRIISAVTLTDPKFFYPVQAVPDIK